GARGRAWSGIGVPGNFGWSARVVEHAVPPVAFRRRSRPVTSRAGHRRGGRDVALLSSVARFSLLDRFARGKLPGLVRPTFLVYHVRPVRAGLLSQCRREAPAGLARLPVRRTGWSHAH